MISIITPCRNAELTIRRTIESVINQNIDDYEYIIIDGLSSDNTVSIIKEYAEKNEHIKYVSEKDKSMTEALNKGLKIATGEIVCSINADDEYCDGALEAVVVFFEQNNVDVLIGATDFYVNGKKSFSSYPKYMCNCLLLNILDCSAPECSVFYLRDVIKKEGYFNENIKYTQDYELYIRLSKEKYRFKYIDRMLSNFYISETQYSTQLYDEMIEEAMNYNLYPKLFSFLKRSRINNVIKRCFGWIRHC